MYCWFCDALHPLNRLETVLLLVQIRDQREHSLVDI